MSDLFPGRPRALVAIALLLWCCAEAVAITGGVSVSDVLDAREDFSDEQVSIAEEISAFSVPLFVLDANERKIGLCTSTIVHPRVVLTAAHCVVTSRNASGHMMVYFERGAAKRQALDSVVHPAFEKSVTPRFGRDEAGDRRRPVRTMDLSAVSVDLALVLLHRPVPETYSPVPVVAPGYRDNRTAQKLIAGFGRVKLRQSKPESALNFAELQGNTRLDEGALGGQREIILLSRYRNGARANVCSGDSGGPLLVREQGASRWRQVAVTSAGDDQCSDAAIFANVDSQRAVLRQMFDDLMQGERRAERNPF